MLCKNYVQPPDGIHEPFIYEDSKVVDFDGLKILMVFMDES